MISKHTQQAVEETVRNPTPDNRKRLYNLYQELLKNTDIDTAEDRNLIGAVLLNRTTARCRFCGEFLPVISMYDYCADYHNITEMSQFSCWRRLIDSPHEPLELPLEFTPKDTSFLMTCLGWYWLETRMGLEKPGGSLLENQFNFNSITTGVLTHYFLPWFETPVTIDTQAMLCIALYRVYAVHTVVQLKVNWVEPGCREKALSYYVQQAPYAFLSLYPEYREYRENVMNEPPSVEDGELKGFAVCRS